MTTTPISLPPDAPAKGPTTAPGAVREIAIAHSPDSDDAFMFYGLATGKIRVPGYKFTHTLCDIETLNHKAMDEAFYDVTAISFHAYPYVQKDYALMACGGSVGENYGPMIVASQRYRGRSDRAGARGRSRHFDHRLSGLEIVCAGD